MGQGDIDGQVRGKMYDRQKPVEICPCETNITPVQGCHRPSDDLALPIKCYVYFFIQSYFLLV